MRFQAEQFFDAWPSKIGVDQENAASTLRQYQSAICADRGFSFLRHGAGNKNHLRRCSVENAEPLKIYILAHDYEPMIAGVLPGSTPAITSLFRRLVLRLGETLCLVLDVDRDLLQRRQVLSAVVGAEEQLARVGE